MNIKIEKNIPIPYGSGKINFPLAEMEVGDSFLLPSEHLKSLRYYLNGTFARNYGDRKFKTKSVDENTHRVWRIK